ncbi:hypothetical protein HMPREF1573_01390 [Gardnerella vaginalis JCP7276]|nr:hypothetical protein HMPREF1573_01390 [Gardnerella vaginalis JCP7276]
MRRRRERDVTRERRNTQPSRNVKQGKDAHVLARICSSTRQFEQHSWQNA